MGDEQTTTHEPNPATCFYMACELRMIFMFLDDWKKIKRIIFCDTLKLYESVLVSINKVLLEHSHIHYILSVAAFVL